MRTGAKVILRTLRSAFPILMVAALAHENLLAQFSWFERRFNSRVARAGARLQFAGSPIWLRQGCFVVCAYAATLFLVFAIRIFPGKTSKLNDLRMMSASLAAALYALGAAMLTSIATTRPLRREEIEI
ncbi:MAG: hypothetical protein Q7S58_09235 [Candidatus Binatus sp.]|uniref:hypothetical protein n=1 Tax=Candidatus Binatus sp. TaxID=2811406 RepID=UPI00271D690A|nr:hypothetical protein [Candidatus Binatus sp.]MDO8432578.1 hypothetical protein [Candidatus Binatus sp.]